jgi:hypothetical protein
MVIEITLIVYIDLYFLSADQAMFSNLSEELIHNVTSEVSTCICTPGFIIRCSNSELLSKNEQRELADQLLTWM